ncbi:hypothetical protein O181_131511 [Austropuccinia psidii MF-1]|uniref:Uncharacterized protein n=1 Tax=Austropuccinia psidii MF-1 TaxID=1389203 RepID=A0A9Q3L490_9BASI|nr:hypothetical protein [Austropuccinia psidii MF-1]
MWFGTHLALGARWLPPLAPFGLIGLGQKGPKRPADRGTWPTDHGLRTVGGLNGPRPPNEKGGPGDPPDPKSMMKAWGLVRCELAKRANDGRIWPLGSVVA